MKTWQRVARLLAAFAAVALMQGCATLGAKSAGDKLDPWEKWNRKVFNFNEKLDEKVLKPVATAYSELVPRPVRNSINNFFGNFGDAWSAVNNFLQGKVTNGLHDVVRVGTNTLLGVGGLVDVATEFGLDHQYEDFGQTLGRWGFGAGAYVVWPLFGPSSVRDSVGLPLDLAASPALLINDGAVKWEITGLQLINKRASLLGATRVLDDIALDKYTFVRDAYLQRRRSLVNDGEEGPAPAPADEKSDADEDKAAPLSRTPKASGAASSPSSGTARDAEPATPSAAGLSGPAGSASAPPSPAASAPAAR
jgi:phospholipid-binding lipoprotein MlaA